MTVENLLATIEALVASGQLTLKSPVIIEDEDGARELFTAYPEAWILVLNPLVSG